MALDAIVIGAGLFGQIITRALRRQGRRVHLVDAGKKYAGSGPAACLMKPSWFSGMGARVYEPSLRLLDELYGVQDIEFELRPLKDGGKMGKATVHWVDPNEVLRPIAGQANITRVQAGTVFNDKGEAMDAPLIVVAAGFWTQQLLPQYPQQGQAGMAFLWPNIKLHDPFIRPWAPYRQLVAFNRGDGMWVGDGTAIKYENWGDERTRQVAERCHEAVRMTCPSGEALMGIRPYARGHKPCLLEEVEPGLWVASGGAKNGTLAAGYCAHVISTRTT